jgi:hypothetical protein
LATDPTAVRLPASVEASAVKPEKASTGCTGEVPIHGAKAW